MDNPEIPDVMPSLDDLAPAPEKNTFTTPKIHIECPCGDLRHAKFQEYMVKELPLDYLRSAQRINIESLNPALLSATGFTESDVAKYRWLHPEMLQAIAATASSFIIDDLKGLMLKARQLDASDEDVQANIQLLLNPLGTPIAACLALSNQLLWYAGELLDVKDALTETQIALAQAQRELKILKAEQ